VPTLRLLQLSDLHLGAPFAWLPTEPRATRRREQRQALEAAIEAAIERSACAILVPGDLFDAEGVDAETMAFAVYAFRRAGCPPVFIAPGNHDPSTSSSPYWNDRLLAARGWSWPAHVHVFREPAWSKVDLHTAPLTIWGRGFVSSAPTFARPLEASGLPAPAALDASRAHVALFHGSREDACPPGQKITAPFSGAELLASPFAYAAAGHYHQPSRIDAPGDAGVRLAYAGSTIALNATETGAHGALEVTLDTDARRAGVQPIPMDGRRVHALEVDVTGAASRDAIDYRIADALRTAGVTERDLVRAKLIGRIVHGVRYEAPGPELAAQVFALRLDLRELHPDYDLDGIRAREASTTEDRFAHALLEQWDAEQDASKRARILSALYYGLDAFRLREVAPAWEAMSAPPEEIEA
jgi:DNA repair exonuclease SbcCD nuclease subunit